MWDGKGSGIQALYSGTMGYVWVVFSNPGTVGFSYCIYGGTLWDISSSPETACGMGRAVHLGCL